jgi:hypothetical protein
MECRHLIQIDKKDIQYGDWIFLKTLNSIYTIQVLGDGNYILSGGWFDRKHLSPFKITINGCTWGGSIIKTDIIAACGLCIEFGNKLVTSRIRKIFYIPGCLSN